MEQNWIDLSKKDYILHANYYYMWVNKDWYKNFKKVNFY